MYKREMHEAIFLCNNVSFIGAIPSIIFYPDQISQLFFILKHNDNDNEYIFRKVH